MWIAKFGLMALALLSLSAQADWRLDGESSRLSFVSSKAAKISEVGRFLTLHGQVDEQGRARLKIDLDSISSGISLRDERLRKELFETTRFPLAKAQASIDLSSLLRLAPGAQQELNESLQVELHGKTAHYRVELLVTRLDEKRFQVVTLAPLLLDSDDFDLQAGLAALRKLANLSSINPTVPVSAVLIFVAP